MRIHVETLFTHDATGRMRRVNEPGGASAPRFFLGRTGEGSEWRFRHDVGSDLVRALEAVCLHEPVGDDISLPARGFSAYRRLLARHAPIQTVWTGPTYRFPDDLPSPAGTERVTGSDLDMLRPHFGEWLADVPQSQPFLALVREGHAVSVCCSVRVSGMAHEAGVETFRDFRGRGYAAHVVSAWASAVRRFGRIPLYSTSWENAASRAVAEKLGLVRYGADLHIT